MRSRTIIPIVLLAMVAAYWWLRPRHRSAHEAYVSDRSVTLWSSTAQVKQPVATLRYGEKVALLQRRGEQAEVRTAQGVRGWLDARLLMEPALWQRSAQLLAQARVMPVQARGRTKVPSNVRIEPGRAAARLYQFARGTSVEVLSRSVVEMPVPAEESQAPDKESSEEPRTRREDWLLVHGLASSGVGPGGIETGAGQAGETVEIAGWVVGRFIELDSPGPVRDYASSSGMRVVAWFELNRAPDEGGERPQYLAAGVRGGEGQLCDFTMIRVYTWGAKGKLYETAYLESNFCGRLPIRVAKAASGEPEFRFAALALSKAGEANAAGLEKFEERVYRMRQTVVRRVRAPHPSIASSKRKESS